MPFLLLQALLLGAALAWAPGLSPPRATRVARVRIVTLGAQTELAETEPTMATEPVGKVVASSVSTINLALVKAQENEVVLQLASDFIVECAHEGDECELVEMSSSNAVNVATALHRLAVINKHQRAGRDALLRDRRFGLLVDAVIEHSSDFDARAVADVLWSFATLQHWPPTLLTPVLTSVSAQLEAGTFEAQHLSTMAWAWAKLECKPVRLLERVEEQAIPLLGEMNTQNCANLLWGFAKLQYKPAKLLPELSTSLVAPGALDAAKPVEISDLSFALGLLGAVGQYDDLLRALAMRAAPDAALADFTSRQVVILIWAVARLKAAAVLPEGMMDAWVGAVRTTHEATPLLAHDARNLERALGSLGIDASWIKRTEMLNTWSEMASGRGGGQSREYTEQELREAFDAIDSDASGDICLDELMRAIKGLSDSADEAAVERMFKFADEDGSGEIDFDEFKSIFPKLLNA